MPVEGRAHRSELFAAALPAGTDRRTPGHLSGTHEVVLRVARRRGVAGADRRLGPDAERHEEASSDVPAPKLLTYVGAAR